MPVAMGGHGQTLMVGLKDAIQVSQKKVYEYDKRELFKLSDGG